MPSPPPRPFDSDAALLEALSNASAGAPLSRLRRAAGPASSAEPWREPLPSVLERWTRLGPPPAALKALGLSRREASAWCCELLRECERLASERSPFLALGLEPEAASPEAVREAFRRLSLESHPDRHPAPERDRWQRRQAELNAARQALAADFERERAFALDRLDLERRFSLDAIGAEEVSALVRAAKRSLERPIPSDFQEWEASSRPRTSRARGWAKKGLFAGLAAAAAFAIRAAGGPAGSAEPSLTLSARPASTPPGLSPSSRARETPAPSAKRPPSPRKAPALAPFDPFDLSLSPVLGFEAASPSIAEPLATTPPATPTIPSSTPTPTPAPERTPERTPAPTPAPSPAPEESPAPHELSPELDLAGRLDAFLRTYAQAYAAEDIERLGEILHPDVLQNGTDGWRTIMDRYEKFFGGAKRVGMRARRLGSPEVGEDGKIRLRFVYRLSYSMAAGPRRGEERSIEGDASMLLEPAPSAPGGFRALEIAF